MTKQTLRNEKEWRKYQHEECLNSIYADDEVDPLTYPCVIVWQMYVVSGNDFYPYLFIYAQDLAGSNP